MKSRNLTLLILAPLAVFPASAQLARPDLDAMAPPVRQAIERLQSGVDALVGRKQTPHIDLGDAYFALGEAYHAHGLTEFAMAAYLESLEFQPAGERAAYYLGCLLQQAGRLAQAAVRFEAVLAQRPKDPAVLIRLGNIQLELAQSAAARVFFARALALDSSLAAAHYGLGRAAFASGEAAAAVEHFERALELQPEASVVRYPLAQAYRRSGDVEKARFHLEHLGQVDVTFPDPGLERLSRIAATSALQVVLSLAADHENFSARDFLGFTLGQLGKTVGSIEYMRQVIADKQPTSGSVTSGSVTSGSVTSGSVTSGSVTSGSVTSVSVELARIHYAVAGLLVLQGRDAEATTELRSAVHLAPNFAAAHVMLANALARTGNFASAADHYDRAIEIEPDSTDAWLKRSAVRLRLGQEERAVAELRQLTTSQPVAGEGWLRLAALLQRRGEAAAAVAAYKKALGLDLEDREKATAHRGLADLLRQQGRLDQAVDQFRSALSFDPSSVETRLELAGTLGFLDRYEEAAAEFRSATDAEPENEAAWLGEISALVLASRFAHVHERLEEAHRSLPKSASLTHLLARFLVASPEDSQRDGGRALKLIQPLFQQRRSLAVGETLAMALMATGASERAVELQRSLISAAEEGGAGEALVVRLKANLTRYESGQKCCADSSPAVLLPPPEPPP